MIFDIPQWRKRGTGPWWDGVPDETDGGGPYDTRILQSYFSNDRIDAARWRYFRDAPDEQRREYEVFGGDALEAMVDADRYLLSSCCREPKEKEIYAYPTNRS